MDKQFQSAIKNDEYIYISPTGLQKLQSLYDTKEPLKNLLWTTDLSLELPIVMKKNGEGSILPQTIIECLSNLVKRQPNSPCLSAKQSGKWYTLTFLQTFELSKQFGQALISKGIQKYSSVNIIGFNSPEWVITFYGSIFAFNFPVGVYTTNSPDICHYIAENSDCELIVCENLLYLQRYLKIWPKLSKLKYIVVYGEKNIPDSEIPLEYKSRIFMWQQFLDFGKMELTNYSKNMNNLKKENFIEYRMQEVQPGNCATIVYTSGTTGPPKGVLLSHDNYTYCAKIVGYHHLKLAKNPEDQLVFLSYMPLSHSSAQIQDILGNCVHGAHVYFADASALQGTLINYMKEVRPTYFFTVPRVWEKIEEALKNYVTQGSVFSQKIFNWATQMGVEGAYALANNKSLPRFWTLANKLVYSKILYRMGLDRAASLVFGAAPMSAETRQFFLSLNMNLQNVYGMTECAGPHTLSQFQNFDKYDKNYLLSTGSSIKGTELMIYKPENDGNGEICMRGRNRFMGYLKMEAETKKTIDSQGFLHSGDIGKIDERGNLVITGRIKELIVTAGGENIPPVLIENEIKEQIKSLSNCMVVGDLKNYLVVLLTLKHEIKMDGSLSKLLAPEIVKEYQEIGSTAKTSAEAKKCSIIRAYFDKAISKVNEKAISRAQKVQKWVILEEDFTVQGGEMTPTLKLKRNVIQQKYADIIKTLYNESKL